MNRSFAVWVLQLLVTATIAFFASAAAAELYINEIYFNPPSMALDTTHEYVELRGTPGMSLADHYLIFVENYDSVTFASGSIEHVFDLTTRSMGTNGFLTLRQKDSPYTVASGTTSLTNSGLGDGFGSGSSSSIGASDSNGDGEIENSGFTAMLINKGTGITPSLGLDLDDMNDGLDVPTGHANWTILDSIGFLQQTEAANSRSYGKINFGPSSVPTSHLEPGAAYASVGYEIEYIARWGNSTGQTAAGWHITNLTNDPASGYQSGSSNFRQSGSPHPANDGNVNTPPPQPSTIDSNQGVPYGTILTNTLGAPNFLSGDYDKNGIVDARDYLVWRNTLGQTGTDVADVPADGNHNYLVDSTDHTVWKARFGQPLSFGSPGAGASTGISPSTVPEPVGWLLATAASLGAILLRKRASDVNR